ncbi:pyruvate formate-lyase-activating protein [Brevibacillus ginsengisoli]|uniref:pyruvate formate-lyase-activating protein n=1 Tax=Brevibacillus ginsengisoli TaxID=363854 RepID=UPI003CE7CDF9
MEGKIHSVETMGLDDGPGIRYILFMQGCPLRCQFCHNPDTWQLSDGRAVDSMTIFEEAKNYMPYYRASGGGITVSGGEPLMQAAFVKDLFRACKEAGIHTALDTTGMIWNDDVEELLQYTDLVLLDLKEMDEGKHHELTGCLNRSVLQFARYLARHNIPVWIRHVLVPGLTDHPDSIEQIGAFIQPMTNIQRVELLPFHKMGEYKWKELNLHYKLTETEPSSEQEVQQAYALLGKYLSKQIMPGWIPPTSA